MFNFANLFKEINTCISVYYFLLINIIIRISICVIITLENVYMYEYKYYLLYIIPFLQKDVFQVQAEIRKIRRWLQWHRCRMRQVLATSSASVFRALAEDPPGSKTTTVHETRQGQSQSNQWKYDCTEFKEMKNLEIYANLRPKCLRSVFFSIVLLVSSKSPSPHPSPSPALPTAKALFDFDAENEGELSFKVLHLMLSELALLRYLRPKMKTN